MPGCGFWVGVGVDRQSAKELDRRMATRGGVRVGREEKRERDCDGDGEVQQWVGWSKGRRLGFAVAIEIAIGEDELVFF